MIIVGITGGIGSGKSVVSRLLRVMGHEVYDCDSEARRIMESDRMLRQSLIKEFGDAIYLGSKLQRQKLAGIVFSDSLQLERLNSHVHKAVGRHLQGWIERKEAIGERVVFVESAILVSSGFDRFVDRVWIVEAPEHLRRLRAVSARCMNGEDFDRRVASQKKEAVSILPSDIIVNDNRHAIIPRVDTLLNTLYDAT